MSPVVSIYRISVARVLVSTYGDKFDHTQFPEPHLLAAALPNGEEIQECLDQCRLNWSLESVNAEAALKNALAYASQQLTQKLEGVYTLLDNENAYLAIYNENGVKIGHDTISALLVDGSEISYTGPMGPHTPNIGGFGIVYVGVKS